LIAPLEDVIDRNERLVIVPYGELHRLPFAALIWRGAWLGEQRTLSYLPSASVRMLARGTSRAPYPVLAIGNPSKMRDQPPFGESRPLDPLPYAEGEAARVAELYGAKPLSGKDATEARVKPALSSHRILHFATHGLLYENAPLMSGVALADGDVLTVYESMGLHLDADLVTLSACKTGLGAQTGGEEVVGLTRGLLAAGARAALVTLWAVLDGSTAVLMTRFYERLKAGDEPALALRQAQAAIRSLSAKEIASERSRARDLSRDVTTGETVQAQLNGAHPRLWAPFVLTGA
jgi:CHAT domain-containing protein